MSQVQSDFYQKKLTIVQKQEKAMFGYIIINKGDMKFKEFDMYHSYYCGKKGMELRASSAFLMI